MRAPTRFAVDQLPAVGERHHWSMTRFPVVWKQKPLERWEPVSNVPRAVRITPRAGKRMQAGGPPAVIVWWAALRGPTLLLSIAPVLVGGSMAVLDNPGFAAVRFAMVLVCAIAIQAGTNLLNDAMDGLRGNDGPGRLGPPRVCASGWRTAQSLQLAAFGGFALAFILGIAIVAARGWPIALAGLASIAAGVAYSAGPRPIAHSQWAEFWVLVFFGPLAVIGTAHVVGSGAVPLEPGLTAGVAYGSLAAAVLALNNLRDHVMDAASGRRTFAVRYGESAARDAIALLLGAPFAFILAAVALQLMPASSLLVFGTAPFALAIGRQVLRVPVGRHFNSLLRSTVRLAGGFAILLAIGFALGAN